ncbi:hypothetical protein [Bacillus tropicus]|uniref:hypothetical protein n=1 Tax=Bacillus tropicus TaxID=2026188 RepID=UPI001CFEEC9D|nr:hypothetical protein [Bacillus tropicus]
MERNITMNAIHSTTILYNETLTAIKNLSTLVSFFLTVKKRELVLFIFEGIDAKKALRTLFPS